MQIFKRERKRSSVNFFFSQLSNCPSLLCFGPVWPTSALLLETRSQSGVSRGRTFHCGAVSLKSKPETGQRSKDNKSGFGYLIVDADGSDCIKRNALMSLPVPEFWN